MAIRVGWVWALAALVLIVCGATATVWVIRDNSETSASDRDCAVVERLGGQWATMVASANAATDTALESREPGGLLAMADRQSAMSDKLRAAAVSVSTPAFKDELNRWADGAALAAQTQRAAVNRPDLEPSDVEANVSKAAAMVDQAGGALAKACPSLRQVLHTD